MASIDPQDLERLRALAQGVDPPTKFEHLVASLMGELLGTSVAVAKSGFQSGGDAGTSGRQQRALRIECKRYKDTTALSARELQGELDDAIARDPGLEVWVLAATRDVPEQLEASLFAKANRLGVPVLVIDWKAHETPLLAALFAVNPDAVTQYLGAEAGKIAHRMRPAIDPALERLRRDMAAWQIGTETLRRLSRDRLTAIWTDPYESRAHFGQVVTGGMNPLVHRLQVLHALEAWWAAPPAAGSPVCLCGQFGVGKTWAVADWLIQRTDVLPPVLLIPASAVPGNGQTMGSTSAAKDFLADRLQELTQVRDCTHWRARLERMLERPAEEGSALLVVFDGLNQQASVQWLELFAQLQSEQFRGRIRVIATTRTHHFETHLHRLAGLQDRAVSIPVKDYDDRDGGEFDKILAKHGLIRSDLHPELHALARNPRLFALVVRFRDNLVDGGAVTTHRLLWEYGRDTAGVSMSREFSAAQWEQWLVAAGEKIRSGQRVFTSQELSALAADDTLDGPAKYRRLSAVMGSPLVLPRVDHKVELTAELMAHALGTTVVFLLATAQTEDRQSLQSEVDKWLDPISGLDQRADILQAAVAIALQSQYAGPLLGVLVAAWLQTQNLAETHVRDAQALAPEMPDALLDAIELSNRYTHAYCRQIAVAALRGVNRANVRVRQAVLARAHDWLRLISRDLDVRQKAEPQAERHRRERMLSRLGVDAAGELTVLGEAMRVVDRDEEQWSEHVPALLEGYPLVHALPVFRVAAIAASTSFNHSGWSHLRWACLLNPVDPEVVATAVRTTAADMLQRVPEPGIADQLNRRVAELLLYLSGERKDDEAANAMKVSLGRSFNYDDDYLADPVRSIFSLERRHALDVLNDKSLPLRGRAQRCEAMWTDPSFVPPPAFCQEVAEAVEAIDAVSLFTGRNLTAQDNDFRQLQAVMARCAPRALAALRRRLARTPAAANLRAPRSWETNRALLLYGPEEVAAARAMREFGRESHEGDETLAGSEWIQAELLDLDALAQASLVVEADLLRIPLSITDNLLPLTTQQVDELIGRFGNGSKKQQRDLVVVLVTAPPVLSDAAWSWVGQFTTSDDPMDVRLAFMVLESADAKRLGHDLERQGWSFVPGTDAMAAHAATGALMEVTKSHAFDQVASRLAPWRLLEAVRARGGDTSEVRVAAEHLDAILAKGPSAVFEVGACLTVERDDDTTAPPWLSVRAPAPPDPHSPEAFRNIFDSDARVAAQEQASEQAEKAIKQARKEGASLYLQFVTREDGLALCRHAPEVVCRWIEDHESISNDFRRRVQQAEGLFLAVCEGLLELDPPRGVSLRNALTRAMFTRIVGRAGVPELVHMLFRAPESPAVVVARDALLSLEEANTDAKLYEIALVAQINGHRAWLKDHIARDGASPLPWRQQRGATLAGFLGDNQLPMADAWTEGPSTSWAEDVARRSARLRHHEACARHWWREYWRLEDREEAYAAWVLFWQCADRRALTWQASEAEVSPNSEALKAIKRRQWTVRQPDWKRGAESTHLHLERKFLGRDTEARVWPWRLSRRD